MGEKFPDAVICAIHAEEALGRNQLPLAYAVAISEICGLAHVIDDIMGSYGIAPSIDHLTESAGRTILGFESAQALRNSLAARP